MSEGHGEPPADVRSFLPRPGEPVEQYAERLRTLHRDLTLVLEAVERGLAAADDPPVSDPGHLRDDPHLGRPVDIVPPDLTATAAPPPEGEEDDEADRARRRLPRVEIVPSETGEARRFDKPAAAPVRDHPREAAPAPEARVPRPAPRFPPRPSVAGGPAREPEWVERAPAGPESFTAPTFPAAAPPPAPQRLVVSPLLAAAFALAWLVVVALLVALLVS